MKLTEEQRNAVRCDQDLMLIACPGSGKTRVIISKLSRAIDAVRNRPLTIVNLLEALGPISDDDQ
jgi:DNA helicase-2/ATP-dependent DNA helicase PcrA